MIFNINRNFGVQRNTGVFTGCCYIKIMENNEENTVWPVFLRNFNTVD